MPAIVAEWETNPSTGQDGWLLPHIPVLLKTALFLRINLLRRNIRPRLPGTATLVDRRLRLSYNSRSMSIGVLHIHRRQRGQWLYDDK